ncbi:MAG: ribbon-helix-helix protein, CopG family [Desulfuromonadales bacterium]|jgi:Arc/MetJ-type ribon-helix-helix transcriptional regulator
MPKAKKSAPGPSKRKSPREKSREKPRSNVISVRVSDEEKQLLEAMTRKRSRNLSEVMREALVHWLTRRRMVCGRCAVANSAVVGLHQGQELG